jgi:hypothetical protein
LADFSAVSVVASGDKVSLDDFADEVAAVAGSAGVAGVAGVAVAPVDGSAGVAGVAAVAGLAGVVAGADAGGAAVAIDATLSANPPRSSIEVFIRYPFIQCAMRGAGLPKDAALLTRAVVD